jgi:hypothetical protein
VRALLAAAKANGADSIKRPVEGSGKPVGPEPESTKAMPETAWNPVSPTRVPAPVAVSRLYSIEFVLPSPTTAKRVPTELNESPPIAAFGFEIPVPPTLVKVPSTMLIV